MRQPIIARFKTHIGRRSVIPGRKLRKLGFFASMHRETLDPATPRVSGACSQLGAVLRFEVGLEVARLTDLPHPDHPLLTPQPLLRRGQGLALAIRSTWTRSLRCVQPTGNRDKPLCPRDRYVLARSDRPGRISGIPFRLHAQSASRPCAIVQVISIRCARPHARGGVGHQCG
jgi:hypothetical protein